MSAAPIIDSCLPPSVDCPQRLIDELRRANVTPFAGLLWGHRQSNRLRVESWARCGETARPRNSAFRRALRSGPPAQGLQCLGWFCSRDSQWLGLTEEDRQLFGVYFPEPWQTVLVLRPLDAAFYFRNSPKAHPARELAAAPGPVLLPTPPARRSRVSPWTAVALVLTGLLVGNALASSQERRTEPPREPLRIIANGTNWDIYWDRRGLASAREPRLEVSQGKRTVVRPISAVEMLAGLVRVPATSGDLQVTLAFGPIEDRVLVVDKPATKRKR